MTSVVVGLASQLAQDLWSSFLTGFLLTPCDLIPPLPVLPYCFFGPSPHIQPQEFFLRTYMVWLNGLSNTIVSALDYVMVFARLRATTLQHYVDSPSCAASSGVSMQLEQVTKIQTEPLLW